MTSSKNQINPEVILGFEALFHMYKILLKNNISFECSANETLVEAATRSGITIDHSCLSGRCNSCRVKVNSGNSEPVMPETALNDLDKSNNYILACIHKPKSDMHIAAEDLGEYNIKPSRTLPAKIKSLEKLTEGIIKVELRFPPQQKIEYIAGQYVNVIKGNIKRSYSVGNSLRTDGIIVLYIKYYEGGLFSEYWFKQAKIGDLLRIEGPKGTFFLRNITDFSHLIFLATGTGIAPVKSIMETLSRNPAIIHKKKIFLFWGLKNKKDVFWNPKNLNIDIRFIPVFSQEQQKSYVQDILLKENVNLKESMVYACGSNNMILDARKKLTDHGLKDENFYSDAFVISN